jgi:Ca2+-binding EF-hand superfamily protein
VSLPLSEKKNPMDTNTNMQPSVWALGVITYMLITGRPPFEGKDETAVFERVRRGRVHYNEKVWSRLSPEALDFTKALLQFDPEKRPSAKECLELPWLAKYQKRRKAIMDGKNGKIFGKEVCESLVRFASYPPLKRAALMVVSHHVKEQDIRDLRDMFLTLDEDHSGELTFEEMYNMIKKYSTSPISEDYFRTVFDEMDHEKTGKVHYMEFLAATLESRVKISGQLLNCAFDHLDVESTGIISIDNLKQLLGKNFTREQVELLIKQGLHHCAECGDDAIVTRADFIQMMGDAQLPSPSPTPTVPDTPTPAETPATVSPSNTPPSEVEENGNYHPAASSEKKQPGAAQPQQPQPQMPFAKPPPPLKQPTLPALTEESELFDISRADTPLPLGHAQWKADTPLPTAHVQWATETAVPSGN